jgi:hypothetical protein
MDKKDNKISINTNEIKMGKDDSFSIGSDHVSVVTKNVVTVNEYFTIITQDGPLHIVVDVSCDFSKINPKYHEICLNILTAKYLNKVSFGDNPFSLCKPIQKRKWWQFWKEPYFTVDKYLFGESNYDRKF